MEVTSHLIDVSDLGSYQVGSKIVGIQCIMPHCVYIHSERVQAFSIWGPLSRCKPNDTYNVMKTISLIFGLTAHLAAELCSGWIGIPSVAQRYDIGMTMLIQGRVHLTLFLVIMIESTYLGRTLPELSGRTRLNQTEHACDRLCLLISLITAEYNITLSHNASLALATVSACS